MSPTSPTRVLGIMSGSSLDGLDLAICGFDHKNAGWTGRILAAMAVPFHPDLRTRLSEMTSAPAF